MKFVDNKKEYIMKNLLKTLTLLVGLAAVAACSNEATPQATQPLPAESDEDLGDGGAAQYTIPGITGGGDCALGTGEYPPVESILGNADLFFIGRVNSVTQRLEPFTTSGRAVETVEECFTITPALQLTFDDVQVITGSMVESELTVAVGYNTLDSWTSRLQSTGPGPSDFEWTNSEQRIVPGQWLGASLRHDAGREIYILMGGFVHFDEDGQIIGWADDGNCTGLPEAFAEAETLEQLINAIPNPKPADSDNRAEVRSAWSSALCYVPVDDEPTDEAP